MFSYTYSNLGYRFGDKRDSEVERRENYFLKIVIWGFFYSKTILFVSLWSLQMSIVWIPRWAAELRFCLVSLQETSSPVRNYWVIAFESLGSWRAGHRAEGTTTRTVAVDKTVSSGPPFRSSSSSSRNRHVVGVSFVGSGHSWEQGPFWKLSSANVRNWGPWHLLSKVVITLYLTDCRKVPEHQNLKKEEAKTKSRDAFNSG